MTEEDINRVIALRQGKIKNVRGVTLHRLEKNRYEVDFFLDENKRITLKIPHPGVEVFYEAREENRKEIKCTILAKGGEVVAEDINQPLSIQECTQNIFEDVMWIEKLSLAPNYLRIAVRSTVDNAVGREFWEIIDGVEANLQEYFKI